MNDTSTQMKPQDYHYGVVSSPCQAVPCCVAVLAHMSLVAYPSSEIQLPKYLNGLLAQLAEYLSVALLCSYLFETYTCPSFSSHLFSYNIHS